MHSLAPAAGDHDRDEALPWPLHSIFLPGPDNENSQSVPGELGWPLCGARSCQEPCQGTSPAGHSRPWPSITGSAREHRCSRLQPCFGDVPVSPLPFPCPYFSQLPCHDGATTWAPQPTQICDGDAMLWAWLFMESKAEPDAENLHFMGNFSIYFVLALEKNLK